MTAETRDLTILILGGYGVFGGRLVHLLSDCAGLTLHIAGRDISQARAFCTRQTGKARCIPLGLDRRNIYQALHDIAPDIIVDASGPFQTYGTDPYAVIRAAIDTEANYLDFADGSDFVSGVAQFDQAAKAAGIFVLSGVSSFPVLTAAVVRHLSKGVTVNRITGGIAPSPYAGIGLNVMRAVIGYAGKPVQLVQDGKVTYRPGLAESRYYTIAPPARLPLRNLRFSLVDVPDLQVIPSLYPDLTDIWIGAAPVPEFLHRLLNLLAKLRARSLLPSMAPLAKLFYSVLNLAKFGEHRGGMFVEIEGTAGTQRIKRSWHLLAEGDDGPLIPSMAIEILIRNRQRGLSPNTGARAALNDLDLSDYEALFAKRTIFTGIRDESEPASHIFKQHLDSAFEKLPQSLQALHLPDSTQIWQGQAAIERGRNPIAALIATIFRFPKSAKTSKATVSINRQSDGSEIWRRTFDGRTFKSHLRNGKGRNHLLITESFGPLTFGLALVMQDGKLYYVPRTWSFLGLPMPKFLTPNGVTYEFESEGKFHFDVEITAPLIGRIVRYRGWLTPAE